MIALDEIGAAAKRAASESLNDSVEDVRVEPGIGSDGDEILRITIVLKEGVIDALGEERFLNTLVSIKRGLRAAGEQHRTIIGYATARELNEDGDT